MFISELFKESKVDRGMKNEANLGAAMECREAAV